MRKNTPKHCFAANLLCEMKGASSFMNNFSAVSLINYLLISAVFHLVFVFAFHFLHEEDNET